MNNWKEKIPAIFAEQGDIVEVPLEAQTDSQVSFETGYTPNYERDAVDDLGNPLVQYGIERTKFNYLMKVITTAIKEVQEVIPVYTEGATDKVDVSSVITATNTFDVLESLLCIDNATGKASRITKEDIITNLNPDVNLSNDNITVSELATTAMDNFLSIDGDIIKKADKMLQSVIEEINLSADNVVISATTTFDNTDSILVTNAEGKVAKATTIPQEKIENINVSKDNISIDEYTDQEPDATFKPIMASNSGKLYTKDTIPSEVIEGDIFATAIKYTVMTAETYPDGLDNLIQTGVYHVIDFNEYKDIINDQIDTTAREEYILSVMNDFLVELNMIKEPFTDIESLAVYAGSDFIYPYEPIIQVIGVSADATDDTKVTQVFKLNGEVKGQRTFTATTDGLTDEVWTPVTTYIRNTIEEELIDFMYDGDATRAAQDIHNMRHAMVISHNSNNELCYAISFLGEVYPNVVTIDTDLEWTKERHNDATQLYDITTYKYNSSLYTVDDTKIIKINKKQVESIDTRPMLDQSLMPKEMGNHVLMVKDRTHNKNYIILVNNLCYGSILSLTQAFYGNTGPYFTGMDRMYKLFKMGIYPKTFSGTDTITFYGHSWGEVRPDISIYADGDIIATRDIKAHRDLSVVRPHPENPNSINTYFQVNDICMDVNVNVDVEGNMTITGDTAIAGNLTISGSTTLKGNLLVEGSETTIGGTTTTINSDTVAINSDTTVDANLTVTGNLHVGSLEADGLAVPIGFIYIQFRGQDSPADLFAGTTWENISSTYAGRFFRAEGISMNDKNQTIGFAAAFGDTQNGGLPDIMGSFDTGDRRTHVITPSNSAFYNTLTTTDQWAAQSGIYGNTQGVGFSAARSSSLYGAAFEVRPVNETIRIWKRTA